MIVLAESGSTKTQWYLLEDGTAQALPETPGINPFLQSPDSIFEILRGAFDEAIIPSVQHVVYYGTGCSIPENYRRMEQVFQRIFPAASSEIYHDLMGAARGLSGDEPGLIGILGTGSNIAYYNGQTIDSPNINMGFILGDEGSGAHLGRLLLRAYILKDLPEELHQAFQKRYSLDRDQIMAQIYHQAYPNRFMASFAPFVKDHQGHAFCQKLIRKNFDRFFAHYAQKMPGFGQLPVHFTGSIAYHFQAFLQEVAQAWVSPLGNIVQSPVENLVSYHQKRLNSSKS